MSERMAGMERVVGGGAARPQSLEIAGAVAGHSLCAWSAHRDHLAPCRGHSSRLRRLLLLPGTPGTQGRLGRHATFSAFAADLAAAQTPPGSHRRHPHETLRPEGRGGRHPSQSHARPRRPEVPLRTYLGHPLAGPAASAVGYDRAALAGDALRPPKDHPQHPQETWLDVPHQAGTGCPTAYLGRGPRPLRRPKRGPLSMVSMPSGRSCRLRLQPGSA